MWTSDKAIGEWDREWKRRGRELRKARKREREHKRQQLREREIRESRLGHRDVVGAYFDEYVVSPDRRELLRIVRALPQMRRWRNRVLRRDGNRCRTCGTTNGLQVDHVTPLSVLLDKHGIGTEIGAACCRELWRARGGQSLCRRCHFLKTTQDAKRYGWDLGWVGRVFGQDSAASNSSRTVR